MYKQINNKMIIVFGAGQYAKEYAVAFREIGIDIYAIIDNDIKRIGENFAGHLIREVDSVFEEVRKDPSEFIFIIGSIKHRDEIRRQILEQNFGDKCCIYTCDEIGEFYFELRKNSKKNYYNINYSDDFRNWTENLLSEVEFWYEKSKEDKNFIESLWGFNRKFYYKYLDKEVKENDTILDVGCGLVSYLGSKYADGGTVNLVPIDPLANYYKAIIDKFSDNPDKEKMYAKFGMFEYLSCYFGENTSDVIIISNALDHCIDPIKGILEALKVLKKETGELVLFHFVEEGRKANYSGLHKWNLNIIDGDFVIWNNKNYVNINKLLKDYVVMTTKFTESKDLSGPRVSTLVNIRKIKDVEPEKILGINDLERMAYSLQTILMMQEDKDYCQKYIELINS